MSYFKRGDDTNANEYTCNLSPRSISINQNDDEDNNECSNDANYVTLNSDWDLDAAFLTSSQPFLCLKCQLVEDMHIISIESRKSTINSLTNKDEWQVINSHEFKQQPPPPAHIIPSLSSSSLNVMHLDPNGHSLIALWSNRATSVLHKQFTSIFSFSNNNTNNNTISRTGSTNSIKSTTSSTPPLLLLHDDLKKKESFRKKPLSAAELKNFLDSDGRVVQLHELRQRIFEGGCDEAKRKELWPILLGVFPLQHLSTMTQKQRSDWLKVKSREYDELKKSLWPSKYWVQIILLNFNYNKPISITTNGVN